MYQSLPQGRIQNRQWKQEKQICRTCKCHASVYKYSRKFMKPSVFIPIAINQVGSLAFYYLLATDDISTAVPICNSLDICIHRNYRLAIRRTGPSPIVFRYWRGMRCSWYCDMCCVVSQLRRWFIVALGDCYELYVLRRSSIRMSLSELTECCPEES